MSSLDFTPLAEALRERLVVIADHAHRDRDAAGHLERLIEVSGRIDALSAALPAEELDPQLASLGFKSCAVPVTGSSVP